MSATGYVFVSIAAVAVLLLTLVVLPRSVVRQIPPATVNGIADPTARLTLENERLRLRNEVRSTCVSFVGSLAVVAGVLIAFQQFTSSQDTVAHSLEASERELVAAQKTATNELFTESAKNLGDPHGAVRVASIEVLDDIAQDDEVKRVEVNSILEAFLHERLPWPPLPTDPYPSSAVASSMPRLDARHPDVQIALWRLGQRELAKSQVNLRHRDLRAADLRNLKYNQNTFFDVHLGAAWLNGADFRKTTFEASNLSHSTMTGTLLCGTNMATADLTGADLTGAIADGTTTWPPGFDHAAAGVVQSKTEECTV